MYPAHTYIIITFVALIVATASYDHVVVVVVVIVAAAIDQTNN